MEQKTMCINTVATDLVLNKAHIRRPNSRLPQEDRAASPLTSPAPAQQSKSVELPRIARPWAHPDDDYKWRSDDGTTVVWTVGGGDWRICTRDRKRARRLRRLTRIELVGECVSGGFEEYFKLDTRKLDTLTVRRLLTWGAE